MSLNSRREYLGAMRERYAVAASRSEKSRIINEIMETLGYHRKYAIQVLNDPSPQAEIRRIKRHRPRKYLEALPVIQLVWEALDYPCAERLHPVLLSTAELLAVHGELILTPEIRHQLTQISRATLARRLARLRSPKSRRTLPHQKLGSRLRSEIPIDRYAWDEDRPGALEVDLVEHNGGSSLGHFAYTITVVDVVSGYSRRRAVLGRGQAVVHRELAAIISEWPFRPWALHTDNGSEFLNDHLVRFAKNEKLFFTRSRPYHKNDSAHVEQKNRQYVREMVGYERYDTPEQVQWLNEVYASLDLYANLFLPMRKVIEKQREGAHVHKRYDTARTPIQRLQEMEALDTQTQTLFQQQLKNLNPLALHRKLERLLGEGPNPQTANAALAVSGLG